MEGPTNKPRVLCVDDEEALLHGLRRQLRSRAQVATAQSAAQGLQVLAEADEPFWLVVSDMRMPGMNGAEFLAEVKRRWPDTVRVLLTGYADVDSAISAVNDGEIFRFLCKPCPHDVLISSVDAACEQYRLVVAERELLELTLRGAVNALVDTLSLANPSAFGRSTRVKRLVAEMCQEVNAPDSWKIEIAAMLSQLGAVTLPHGLVAKLDKGMPVEASEQVLVDRLPEVSAGLIEHIPRLEGVIDIIRQQRVPFVAGGLKLPLGARLLHIALDYDELESRGVAADDAVATMRSRANRYDPTMLAVLHRMYGDSAQRRELLELPIEKLRVGMVLAADVCTVDDVLLVGRGQDVTVGLLEHIRNFSKSPGVREPIVVTFPVVRVRKRGGDHKGTPANA